MSELSDISDRLNAAADRAEAASKIIYDVANGDENTQVQTEVGAVDSLARLEKRIESEIKEDISEISQKLEELFGISGSDGIGFNPGAVTGFNQAQISVGEALRANSVNIMHFGAAGIGGDDTVAIKYARDYALKTGKTLYAPGGNYGFTEDIVTKDKSFTIVGDGTGLTKFWMDYAGKGFVHSSTDRTQKLTVFGIGVVSSNQDAISAFDITYPVTSAVDQSQLSMTDVETRVSGSGAFSYACIRIQGVKNPFLDQVVTRGVFTKTLYGISLEGQTIDAQLTNCRSYLVGYGVNISGANEGTTITGYTAVSVKGGVEVSPDNGGPWVCITNFHINSSEFGIRTNRRTQVEIGKGLLYANHLFGSESWVGIAFSHDDGKFAEYCNVDNVIFNRQTFAGATIGVSYKNSRYCTLTNCAFVNIQQPIVEDANSHSNHRFLNQYPNIANPVTKNGLLGGEPFRINTTFAQNRLLASGALSGSSPSLSVEGVDATIGLELNAKGPNAPISLGSVGAGTGLQILVPANTVNRPRAVGAVAGNPATLDATGSDSIIWLAIRGKSTGGAMLPTTIPLNFANDSAAASGGVPIGGIYHTSGSLKIRYS